MKVQFNMPDIPNLGGVPSSENEVTPQVLFGDVFNAYNQAQQSVDEQHPPNTTLALAADQLVLSNPSFLKDIVTVQDIIPEEPVEGEQKPLKLSYDLKDVSEPSAQPETTEAIIPQITLNPNNYYLMDELHSTQESNTYLFTDKPIETDTDILQPNKANSADVSIAYEPTALSASLNTINPELTIAAQVAEVKESNTTSQRQIKPEPSIAAQVGEARGIISTAQKSINPLPSINDQAALMRRSVETSPFITTNSLTPTSRDLSRESSDVYQFSAPIEKPQEIVGKSAVQLPLANEPLKTFQKALNLGEIKPILIEPSVKLSEKPAVIDVDAISQKHAKETISVELNPTAQPTESGKKVSPLPITAREEVLKTNVVSTKGVILSPVGTIVSSEITPIEKSLNPLETVPVIMPEKPILTSKPQEQAEIISKPKEKIVAPSFVKPVARTLDLPSIVSDKLSDTEKDMTLNESVSPIKVIFDNNERVDVSQPHTNINPSISLPKTTSNLIDGPELSTVVYKDKFVAVEKIDTLQTISSDEVKVQTTAPIKESTDIVKPFEQVISHAADFFNQKVAYTKEKSETLTPNLTNLENEIYLTAEERTPVKGFQFNPGGFANSIKMDNVSAKIKVFPPELGQITANVTVNKGVTELSFMTDNTQVKHFIETNIQQLRDSFRGADVNLGHVSVQSHLSGERQAFADQQRSQNDRLGYVVDNGKEHKTLERERPKSNSLVDTYA